MAANDQIVCLSQILKQTRSGARALDVSPVDYSMLDETDPKTSVYVRGVFRPDGGGITAGSAGHHYHEGEYAVVQLNNRNASDKTLDSTGSTSGVFLLQYALKDVATSEITYPFLTDANRSTALFADDPVMTSGKWRDAYAFLVPAGEEWQFVGLWRADFRTTA
jgi:hypothetical protein